MRSISTVIRRQQARSCLRHHRARVRLGAGHHFSDPLEAIEACVTFGSPWLPGIQELCVGFDRSDAGRTRGWHPDVTVAAQKKTETPAVGGFLADYDNTWVQLVEMWPDEPDYWALEGDEPTRRHITPLQTGDNVSVSIQAGPKTLLHAEMRLGRGYWRPLEEHIIQADDQTVQNPRTRQQIIDTCPDTGVRAALMGAGSLRYAIMRRDRDSMPYTHVRASTSTAQTGDADAMQMLEDAFGTTPRFAGRYTVELPEATLTFMGGWGAWSWAIEQQNAAHHERTLMSLSEAIEAAQEAL